MNFDHFIEQLIRLIKQENINIEDPDISKKVNLKKKTKNPDIPKQVDLKKKTKRVKTKYFEKGVRRDWHHHSVFNENVLKFGELYARQPEMKKAKEMHKKIMKRVEDDLKEIKIFSRLEFVGSSYEGVKVTDLEFDVMVIMKVPSLVKETINLKPNFAFLKPKNDEAHQQLLDFIDRNDHISSAKVTDFFFKHLQKCCNTLEEKTILRKHGPAIQMDVIENNQVFYSVDIVPTLTVDEEFYVAKQLKTLPSFENNLTWRKTFSLQEKNLLSSIDESNGCRKQVLRILKAIRNSEPSLQKVTSYILKNVMLRVQNQQQLVSNNPSKKDPWDVNNISSRLMDVIKKLRDELSEGNVPCYFDRSINLIDDLKPITISNIKDRLTHLLNSYIQMNKILKVQKKDVPLNVVD